MRLKIGYVLKHNQNLRISGCINTALVTWAKKCIYMAEIKSKEVSILTPVVFFDQSSYFL